MNEWCIQTNKQLHSSRYFQKSHWNSNRQLPHTTFVNVCDCVCRKAEVLLVPSPVGLKHYHHYQRQRSDCSLAKNATTHAAVMHSGQLHPPFCHYKTIPCSGTRSLMPLLASPVPILHSEERLAEPGESFISGLCLFRSFSLQGTFMSRLLCSYKTSNNALRNPVSLHQRGMGRREEKGFFSYTKLFWLTFDLTTKDNPDSLIIIQVLRMTLFPTLEICFWSDTCKLK